MDSATLQSTFQFQEFENNGRVPPGERRETNTFEKYFVASKNLCYQAELPSDITSLYWWIKKVRNSSVLPTNYIQGYS